MSRGNAARRASPVKRLEATAAALVATAAALTCLVGCSQTSQVSQASRTPHSSQASHAADARPELKVSGGYIPQPPMADMAAGYFTVINAGKAADELTGVTSDFASDVSMHTTTRAGGMQDAKALPIPADGKLVLSTGGNHLMLMGLKKKPAVGEKVSFELHFATSPPITLQVPVEPATYQPPPED